MPMQWNDQADARLFANVLKLHVVKLDYSALARAMGNGVTPKAISHRISKIKDKARAYGKEHAWAFDGEDELWGPNCPRGTGLLVPPLTKRGRRNQHAYGFPRARKNGRKGTYAYDYEPDSGSDDSDEERREEEEEEKKRILKLKMMTPEERREERLKVLGGWRGEMRYGEGGEEDVPIWVWRSGWGRGVQEVGVKEEKVEGRADTVIGDGTQGKMEMRMGEPENLGDGVVLRQQALRMMGQDGGSQNLGADELGSVDVQMEDAMGGVETAGVENSDFTVIQEVGKEGDLCVAAPAIPDVANLSARSGNGVGGAEKDMAVAVRAEMEMVGEQMGGGMTFGGEGLGEQVQQVVKVGA